MSSTARKPSRACAGTTPSGPSPQAAEAVRRPTHRPAPGAVGQRLVPRLDVVQAGGEQERDRAREQEVARRPARLLGGSTPTPRPGRARGAPGVTSRPARESMTTSRASPMSRAKLQRLWPIWRPSVLHLRREQRGRVVGRAHLVGRARTGLEVARARGCPGAGRPSRPSARRGCGGRTTTRRHLVHPALRDPPFGVDLVVVEDHRRRHRGEQPADDRLAPRLVVGERVLAEVGELVLGHVVGARGGRAIAACSAGEGSSA